MATSWSSTVCFSHFGRSLCMDTSDIPDRLVVAVIALVVVLTPVVILALTLSLLTATTTIPTGELTPVVLLELYLLELVVLVAVGYFLYRLSLRLASEELPDSLDALAESESSGESEEGSDRRDAEPE